MSQPPRQLSVAYLVLIALGIILIIVANSFSDSFSWWTGWAINAVGWSLVVGGVVPLTKHRKKGL